MGNTLRAIGRAVTRFCGIVVDFLFPIETELKFHNETNTKLKEIRIEAIGDTFFETKVLANPNAQTGVKLRIKRAADDCYVKVTLSFDNDLKDIIQLNQAYADNRANSCDFKHTLCSHKITYKKQSKTIKVIIAHTQEQLDNDLAEELIRDALSKSQQKRFEEALSKLEKAQKKATSSKIQDKIRNDIAYVLNSQGLDEELQGFDFENKDMPDDAATKFNNAKEYFQRVQKRSANKEYSKNLERVSCKIDGNNLLNEGNDLIEQVLNQISEHLSDNNHCKASSALKDCDIALDKCRRAEQLFKKGAKNCNDDRFEASLNFVKETMEQINQIKMDINLKQCNAKKTQQSTSSKKVTKNNQYYRQM